MTGYYHLPARGATSTTTNERTKVEVGTKMPEDTIFPPQLLVAVRLSGDRIVYRDAAVELASMLVKEVKEPFFDDLLVARVYGEHVLLELEQFPGSTPEFRVKRRDAQSIKHILDNLYPCAGGSLRCVRGCWSGVEADVSKGQRAQRYT